MISVIMTTYNAGRTIRKALEGLTSVLNELRADYEIVATDNESEDNTVEVLNEFGARVKVMKCTRGLGRHVAASMSRGDYLLFYDADAYANEELLYNFLSTTIKRGVGFSLAHTGVHMVSRRCYSLTGGFSNLNFAEDFHFWARAFTFCRSLYYPIRVACNAPRLYAVRGYRGERRYTKGLLYFVFRQLKNEVHRLRGLALSPSEVAQVVRGGDPLMIGGAFLLGPLSSLIGDRVSRGFSNVELVYLQELRNMGKIEDVSPEGKYIVQDIYFVRDWRSIFEEFLRKLRPYGPEVIEHAYARVIYTRPDIASCPPP
ncbi:MAG: glycosyltransferase family 2 protein [Acidilobus sp.]